jgi:hypothetical protein
MNAMQDYFLRLETDQYWFYSMLFYTDLGYYDACEEYARSSDSEYGSKIVGGAYV